MTPLRSFVFDIDHLPTFYIYLPVEICENREMKLLYLPHLPAKYIYHLIKNDYLCKPNSAS
jgi:hypothetical protein